MFRPVDLPKSRATLLFSSSLERATPSSTARRTEEAELSFAERLALHDPPVRTLEGFVNRPDW